MTILGWLWIAFAAFSLFTGSLVLVIFRLMDQWRPGGQFPPPGQDVPPGFEPMSWFLEYFTALAATQLAVSAFSIYAAVEFLRLRPWSRSCFEVLNWVALLYSVGFGAFWVYMWLNITSAMQVP